MTEPTRPVVILGDVLGDVTVRLSGPIARGTDTGAQVLRGQGGSAGNTAAWLAHLGHPVHLVCGLGTDHEGDLAEQALTQLGVHVHATRHAHLLTGTCVVLVEPGGERSMLPDPGASAELGAGAVPEHLFTAGAHLHVTAYALFNPGARPAALRALELARAAQMTISVDPASAAPLRGVVERDGSSVVRSWFSHVDLLLPNEQEVAVLARLAGQTSDEPAQQARALLDWAHLVVVTLGRGGALATRRHDPGHVLRVPAGPAAAVDTTGAGDAFAAGFLHSWLAATNRHDTGTVIEALRAGCELGSVVVTAYGSRPPRPSN